MVLSTDEASMDPESTNVNYTLPPHLDIGACESLAEALIALPIHQQGHLVLDASRVETVTSCGAQLLASLDKTIRRSCGTLEIKGHNNSFTEALNEMGLGWLTFQLNA